MVNIAKKTFGEWHWYLANWLLLNPALVIAQCLLFFKKSVRHIPQHSTNCSSLSKKYFIKLLVANYSKKAITHFVVDGFHSYLLRKFATLA
jgi:hypothetical protein